MSELIQWSFVLMLLIIVVVGFYCAAKLDHTHPAWVRFVTLSPSLVSLFGLYYVTAFEYQAYALDLMLTLTLVLMYLVVASRFSSNPWLDIKVQTNEVVE